MMNFICNKGSDQKYKANAIYLTASEVVEVTILVYIASTGTIIKIREFNSLSILIKVLSTMSRQGEKTEIVAFAISANSLDMFTLEIWRIYPRDDSGYVLSKNEVQQ